MTEMVQLRDGMGAMYGYLGLKYGNESNWESDLVARTQATEGVSQSEKDAMTQAIQSGKPMSTMFASDEQEAIQQTVANSLLAGGGVYLKSLGQYYAHVGESMIANKTPGTHLGSIIETAVVELGGTVSQKGSAP